MYFATVHSLPFEMNLRRLLRPCFRSTESTGRCRLEHDVLGLELVQHGALVASGRLKLDVGQQRLLGGSSQLRVQEVGAKRALCKRGPDGRVHRV